MKILELFFLFIRELWKNRPVIIELARRDFQSKYLGSYLGMLWAFVHPSVYVGILWFVFQIGFKSKPEGNYPFILWMLCGIIPWFFFSECLMSATNAVLDNSYLLKKMVFSIAMLPIVKIISSLVIHVFFIVIIFIMLLCYGYPANIHWLQVFYYLFAMLTLLQGLTWLTSALVVFMRDVGQLVAMALQFLFWFTPIFWSAKLLPEKYLNLVKINPIYYIVEGYRESFIYQTWFWERHYLLTIYFWSVTGAMLVCGATVFRRLRPHFADVL